MEPRLKPFAALATAILTLALTTCSNPIDFVAEITDAVMAANDKYLEVIAVTPVKNEPAFSPDDPILIEFDRDIDLESVTDATVSFTPSETFAASFDIGTNTLTILPTALNGETDYQITVTSGVRGTDGSQLRAPYIWNFHTSNAPTGSVVIKDRDNSNATYTNSATANKLEISANGVVGQMRYSKDPFLATDGTVPWVDLAALIDPFTLNTLDGVQTVYIQFRDSLAGDHRSSVKTDTIVLDTTAPGIVLNNAPTYIGTSGWTSNVTVTEVGSGIAAYAWSITTGASLATISPTNQVNTTVTPTGEGSLRLRLLATDGAGNTGTFYTSTTPYIVIDLYPPGPPIALVGPTSPSSANPSYTWGSGGGGTGYYRYNFNGGAWSSDLNATSYSTTSTSYGTLSFSVQERDVAGNWSTSNSWSYFFFPSWLRPIHASIGNSTRPALVFGLGTAVFKTTCKIYGGFSSKGMSQIASFAINPGASYTFMVPTLPGNTKYYWSYELIPLLGHGYQSPIYYFTTGLF